MRWKMKMGFAQGSVGLLLLYSQTLESTLALALTLAYWY